MFKRQSREPIPLATSEDTGGLGIVKEIWYNRATQERRTFWKYCLPDVALVLALTPEGRIVAIREFQPGVGTEYLKLVGETLEPGESARAAAKRGLLEETGYCARQWEQLTTMLENSGRSDRRLHLFLAQDCRQVAEREAGIRTTLLAPEVFWKKMMRYWTLHPRQTHGGAGTIKLMTLAFEHLHWLGLQIPKPRGES